MQFIIVRFAYSDLSTKCIHNHGSAAWVYCFEKILDSRIFELWNLGLGWGKCIRRLGLGLEKIFWISGQIVRKKLGLGCEKKFRGLGLGLEKSTRDNTKSQWGDWSDLCTFFAFAILLTNCTKLFTECWKR